MRTLRIHLLGPMELKRGEESLAKFPTQKSLSLFSYLALHGQKLHPREILASIFWPEGSSAMGRKRLRTELWLTRKFLEPIATGESLFTVTKDSLGLNPQADLWIDVAEIETRLAPFARRGGRPTADESRQLEQATDLYRGDLLEGRSDDWCLEARESLRIRFLAALEQLMTMHQKRRDWGTAIECGRKILRFEPLTEAVHRNLMRCYFEMGDRAAALRQYKRCAALLGAELDVGPMYETSLLYQQIKDHQGPVKHGISTAANAPRPELPGA